MVQAPGSCPGAYCGRWRTPLSGLLLARKRRDPGRSRNGRGDAGRQGAIRSMIATDQARARNSGVTTVLGMNNPGMVIHMVFAPPNRKAIQSALDPFPIEGGDNVIPDKSA